jgi:hypothetical protein
MNHRIFFVDNDSELDEALQRSTDPRFCCPPIDTFCFFYNGVDGGCAKVPPLLIMLAPANALMWITGLRGEPCTMTCSVCIESIQENSGSQSDAYILQAFADEYLEKTMPSDCGRGGWGEPHVPVQQRVHLR